ncbi:MAG: GNAT family N-acetyltransferase [Chloroflexi bacterium]|nr:GNAT family N-acetyltransferase [Chloroflexota bacterium]
MIIRPVEERDFDEWLRMRLTLWPDQPANDLRAELATLRADESTATFVADRDDGALGGFVEAGQRKYAEDCDTSPVGYIEGWYVDADLRGQGIGRALVRAAEQWAIAQGFTEMGSDTWIDNEVSYRAHLAIGYEEAERLIHFRKQLKP